MQTTHKKIQWGKSTEFLKIIKYAQNTVGLCNQHKKINKGQKYWLAGTKSSFGFIQIKYNMYWKPVEMINW